MGRGKRILVTGGAGFIGSHLVRALVHDGHEVVVLDSLEPQVHGKNARPSEAVPNGVVILRDDIRDREACEEAIAGVEIVYHLVAAVGVGQSMYEIERYVDVNTRGTAVLLEALAKQPPERLIVASSMSVYGEGSKAGGEPFPTSEIHAPEPRSVYAMTKYDQEQLCLIFGRAHNIPTVALRFFNVYGPGQSLANPYTGVLATFATQCLTGQQPTVYEDGQQTRDFVHVSDVVQALWLAMKGGHGVYNIGTGHWRTIRKVAEAICQHLAPDLQPFITGQYREGDVRHCFANVEKARWELGYLPRTLFDDGIAEFCDWAKQQSPENRTAKAEGELLDRGLLDLPA